MMPLAFLPDPRWMRRALELAAEAASEGEVPVGAVVVYENRVIGEGRNRREALKQAAAHGEMEAISQACTALGDWRLSKCQLYVTLEPCPMCTGAIINAHLGTVVYGADDERAGCTGTAMNLFALPYSHRPLVYRGFMEEESRFLLQDFFRSLRKSQV